MKKRILFVVNVDWFFKSHRLPLALEAIKRDWDVFLITKNTGKFEDLTALGLTCIDIDFERSGKNPFKELSYIVKLKKIYQQLQPNIIHHITLKPSIYGTIAARKTDSNPKVINAVSGLGYSFTDNRKTLSKWLLIQLLKIAFKNKCSNFIFQNPDDKKVYADFNFLNEKNHIIIKGSGVDENEFKYFKPVKKDRLHITLVGRMLKDKGILEFIRAAKHLRSRYKNKIKFILVGNIDLENPAHIRQEELDALCDQDYIFWTGYSQNIRQFYEQSDVACLPSYREGLPKSLVEAMAIGRPIITTDAIGCKECVENGINGYLVPVKDFEELAESIEKLILDDKLRLEMGLKSRDKMVKEMSLSHVISETFKFYE